MGARSKEATPSSSTRTGGRAGDKFGTPGLRRASPWHNVLVLTDNDKGSEDAGDMKVLCLVLPHKFGDPEEGLDSRTHETCARCGLTRLIRPPEGPPPSVDQRNILGGPNTGGF